MSGGAGDGELELGSVPGRFLDDDVETEWGGETTTGEVGDPGVVVMGVTEGGVADPGEVYGAAGAVAFEVVAFLVRSPLVHIEDLGREVDERFDDVGVVIVHPDSQLSERDVVERVVGDGDRCLMVAVFESVETEGLGGDTRSKHLGVFVECAVGDTTGLDLHCLEMGGAETTEFVRSGCLNVAALVAGGTKGASVGIGLAGGCAGERCRIGPDFNVCLMVGNVSG